MATATDSAVLLYHTNLFLFSIVGLFVIAKLPRVIALFGTTSEWFAGYLLHYSPSTRSRAPHATKRGAPVAMRYPPHVNSCIKFLRPCLKHLRLRISPGFSIAQSLIVSIYFACLAYASFYKSNIFTDQSRTGWVATAQLPLLFALAQKNNVLGLLLGCAYENVTIVFPTQRKIIRLKYYFSVKFLAPVCWKISGAGRQHPFSLSL
jgi:ferric-chelate reductase